jgi:protein TonB
MSVVKESDTLYICRNYNIYGPIISWESYKDSAFETPNGLFAWYNKNGRIDSMGQVHNGKKTGEWYSDYTDSFEMKIKRFYEEGKLLKTIDYHSNMIIYPNGETDSLTKEIIDTTDRFPADFKGGIPGWTKYLQKNLVTPERLFNLSRKDTIYTVTVKFTINKTGEVVDAFLLRSSEWSADKEALSILNKSPKWIPAMIKGKPVFYTHRQNISFRMSN